MSTDELQRLTLFKWRYQLEGAGFSPDQVSDLMFLTWMRVSGRLAP